MPDIGQVNSTLNVSRALQGLLKRGSYQTKQIPDSRAAAVGLGHSVRDVQVCVDEATQGCEWSLPVGVNAVQASISPWKEEHPFIRTNQSLMSHTWLSVMAPTPQVLIKLRS